jgi:hypothetical protein
MQPVGQSRKTIESRAEVPLQVPNGGGADIARKARTHPIRTPQTRSVPQPPTRLAADYGGQ